MKMNRSNVVWLIATAVVMCAALAGQWWKDHKLGEEGMHEMPALFSEAQAEDRYIVDNPGPYVQQTFNDAMSNELAEARFLWITTTRYPGPEGHTWILSQDHLMTYDAACVDAAFEHAGDLLFNYNVCMAYIIQYVIQDAKYQGL